MNREDFKLAIGLKMLLSDKDVVREEVTLLAEKYAQSVNSELLKEIERLKEIIYRNANKININNFGCDDGGE